MATPLMDRQTDAPDWRDPAVRLTALLDPGSMRPLAPFDNSGVYVATGTVAGGRIVAYASDPQKMGGAMGSDGCRHIVDAIDTAVRERVPVVGLWHSGGARLAVGEHPLVTAPKSMLGHLLGAAGAVETIATILSVRDGVVPVTRNLEDLDDGVELDVVSVEAARVPVPVAVNDAFGFGGHNVALVVTRA